MLEAVIVAAASAIILMVMIYAVPDCQPIRGYVPENATTTEGPMTVGPGLLPEEHNSSHVLHRRSADHVVNHADNGDFDVNGTEDHHDDDHHHELYGLHGSHGYLFQV